MSKMRVRGRSSGRTPEPFGRENYTAFAARSYCCTPLAVIVCYFEVCENKRLLIVRRTPYGTA